MFDSLRLSEVSAVFSQSKQMTTFLKVLSVDTEHSSACVAVFSDNSRLLFNCGEGTQRLCVEHKVRLSKVSGVFVTSTTPKLVCGLPGYVDSLCVGSFVVNEH